MVTVNMNHVQLLLRSGRLVELGTPAEEEKLVVEMQAKLGNKWAKIASCLPGRTDNDVKNFWSTRQKRILRALQRPKMPSGSTDASADTSDLSKDPQSTDFGGFQVNPHISNFSKPLMEVIRLST